MMDSEKQYELMAKSLSGNITGEEQALLNQWLGESKENALAFEQVKQAWALTSQQTVVADTDSAWNKLKGSIEAEEKTEVIKIVPMRWAARIAAAVVALVAIGFLLNNYVSSPQLKTIASGNQTLKVVLPDNSVAWLNKNSELEFTEKFSGNKREVKLKGEAFFDVVHDEAKPFIITANQTVTEDIGTSFNVRAMEEEGTVEVTVATGKVSFTEEGDKGKIFLSPGDRGVFEKQTHRLSSLKNNDANYMAWQTGKVVFDKSTLREVAATLGRYYNTSFATDSAAADVLFTGTFDHASVEDAIKILETSTGSRISKQQNSYIISAKQ
jgi:ferric-dicitrate binding protein FerR (iron transport regulator)